jgi:SAM-dependent methyltransferase
MPTADPDAIRSAVRARYAAAAAAVTRSSLDACCAIPAADALSRDLYTSEDMTQLPDAALLASLGCGNPSALAELRPGEVVLDLGSGGGIDVLLSARRVGQNGFVYGLDMTDEMLQLARRNAAEQRVANVRFLKGEIERIPLPDASVDVVISNCVINLSADKPRVLCEAFRVLKPAGRFAVSDVVVQGHLPASEQLNLDAWASCVSGALEESEYRGLLIEAGFVDIGFEVTRVHASEPASTAGARFVSAFVRASKPPRGAVE